MKTFLTLIGWALLFTMLFCVGLAIGDAYPIYIGLPMSFITGVLVGKGFTSFLESEY